MAIDLKKLTVTAVRSDGEVFRYNGQGWKVSSLEGAEYPEVEVFRKTRGFGHGSLVTGKRMSERDITITARSMVPDYRAKKRLEALTFHDPNQTYTIHLEYLGQMREAADCEIIGFKAPTGNIFGQIELTCDFLAPSPYYTGETFDETKFQLAGQAPAGLWHTVRSFGSLPFSAIPERSCFLQNRSIDILPVRITITFADSENFWIRADERIVRISGDFHPGDVLILDGRTKRATLNGQAYTGIPNITDLNARPGKGTTYRLDISGGEELYLLTGTTVMLEAETDGMRYVTI